MAENEENKTKLRVITPNHVLFDRFVKLVVLRGTEGELGVLAGHEKSVILLDYGDVRIYEENTSEQTDTLAVFGGFAIIVKDSVTILSDFAEHPNHIDAARLEKIRQRADSRRRSARSGTKIQLAEVALRRSLVRGDAGISALMDDINLNE